MITIHHTNIYKLDAYSKHLKALVEEDKVSRFGYSASDQSIDQLMLSICYHPDQHELWFATIDENCVGWGHLAKTPSDAWELAVSVDREFQGRGVGDKLITEMIRWSKFHHISEVFMQCISKNKAIQRLAQKHGLIVKQRFFDEIVASVEVPDPDIFDANTQLWKEHTELIREYEIIQNKLTKLWIFSFNQNN